MSNISIKEMDLNVLTEELVNEALEIDRPDRERICNFVLNLATNGGRRTQAALDAGYGSNDEAGKKVASSKAARLLENAGISSLYKKICAYKFRQNIFVKLIEKQHLTHMLYQLAISCQKNNPRASIGAIQEIGKLSGFYEEKGGLDPAIAALAGKNQELQLLLESMQMQEANSPHALQKNQAGEEAR